MGKSILIGARYSKIRGDIFSGFWHAIDAKACLHLAVHKSPSDGCIKNLSFSGKGAIGFGDDHGRAGHAFHAASQNDLRFTRFDCACAHGDGVQSRAA
jgi:hypothetical protein